METQQLRAEAVQRVNVLAFLEVQRSAHSTLLGRGCL